MSAKDAFGLEQVFDGNTDFTTSAATNNDAISSNSYTTDCTVHSTDVKNRNAAAAGRLRTLLVEDTFAPLAEHAADGEVAMRRNNSLEGKEIIPYSSSQIQVSKEVSKRSRRNPICSFPPLMSKKVIPREKEAVALDHSAGNDVEAYVPGEDKSSSLALSCDSVHHDDTLSEISSTCSVLSLQESPLPLSTVSSMSMIVGNNNMSNSSGCKRVVMDLPDVHGRRDLNAQVQMRRLNKQLELVRSENEVYQKQVNLVPSFKQELTVLKSTNFELLRENANLKSQLASARC